MIPLPDFETSPDFMELMDLGKKIADTYAMHRLADPIGNLGMVFAVKLQDASTDNVLYPDRKTAREYIGRRDDEDRYMYVQLVPSSLPPRDAAIMLRAQRRMFLMGIRQRTMGGRVMIPRLSREDQAAQLRSIFKGTPPTNVRGI